MKIILLSPFLNEFDKEVYSYRPFYYWLKNKFPTDRIYVSSILKHKFLYDDFFIYFDSYIEDYEEKRNKKWFRKIIKFLKNEISIKENIQSKDIEELNLPLNNMFQIPEEFKIYNKITYVKNLNNNIICILKRDEFSDIHLNILNNYNIKVIFEEDYEKEDIFKEICNCKLCLTNIDHWMFICNLQNIPLFGWGQQITRFKHNELWNFRKY